MIKFNGKMEKMDSNEHRGYEGYGSYSTSSSDAAPVASYSYSAPWEAEKANAGATAMTNSAGPSESTDSIIAKINQRLDLLSQDKDGKASWESSFSFEAFEPYMNADKESSLYSEEAGAGGEGPAEPPQNPENHSAGRPGKRGGGRRGGRGAGGGGGGGGGPGGNKTRGGGNRGGGRGGYPNAGRAQNRRGGGGGGGGYSSPYQPHYPPPRDPYMHYGPPHPHPASSSSSERLSAHWNEAHWNELHYMGPHSGMGPWGPVRAPFPGRRGMPGPPHHHHHHPAHPHGMMGPPFPPFPPYGPPGGPGSWHRPVRKRARKARGGSQNAEGKKRRRTESDGEEFELRKMQEEDDDNGDMEPEEGGTGEETEKQQSFGGEGEEDEEPKKKSKVRKNKEKQKERSKLLYICSLCKLRTPDEEEMNTHMESRLHKDIIDFLETKMPGGTAKFLQEYTVYRNKKIKKKMQDLLNKEGRSQKVDPFIDLAQDEFCRRIEAAHCTACDLFIPGQRHLLHQHLSSKEHQRNRQAVIDRLKMSSGQVAKSILCNKSISDMMEKHLKGEDPFTEDAEDHETQEEGAVPASEGTSEQEGQAEADGGLADVAKTSTEDTLPEEGVDGEGEGEGAMGGEEEGYSDGDLEGDEEDGDLENPVA